MVGGWPVQFLPPRGPLVEDALELAGEVTVEGIPTRVFSAEHLAAIALETGRAKDRSRLLQFFESDVLDVSGFRELVRRLGLEKAWARFERQYLGEEP